MFFRKNGNYIVYSDYTNNFVSKYGTNQDIIEIWRGDELIAKRVEKSEREIEIDRIESEMRKLEDDLRKVNGE